MKVRIKNPIWGVPITILNYLCSDGLLHFDAPMRERERVSNCQVPQGNRREGFVSQRKDTLFQNTHQTYKIIGIDRYVEDNPNYGKRFRINNKEVYARILIKSVSE